MTGSPEYDQALGEVIATIIELHERDAIHALAIKVIDSSGNQIVCCGGCRSCLQDLLDETMEDLERDERLTDHKEVLPN